MTIPTKIDGFMIRHARESDVPLILRFVQELAEYEKLSHEVLATEEDFRKYLFGEKQFAEVVIGEYHSDPVGYALYFYSFSTFTGKPGIYLEDIYVKPDERGRGFGKTMLAYLARLAVDQQCGRYEWAVLDWNEPSISFYESLGATLKKEWIIARVTGSNLLNLASQF
ncbi:MAG: GNAT family acetyltransferase [Bacteroides sp. SM1_62]|nr:MAG: GNAT family acetyltransferase [Bacteroides sp. SM23_62]KPL22059.1 MAG: GNAT family acetyltransferase [Bacteroides sp. SM1_62]